MTICQCCSNGSHAEAAEKPVPSDAELEAVLHRVRLGLLLERGSETEGGRGLNNQADWGGILSLGEQQRLAFARLDPLRFRLTLQTVLRFYSTIAEIRQGCLHPPQMSDPVPGNGTRTWRIVPIG